MRFLGQSCITLAAAALAVAIPAGAAMAKGYSGKWPVTITQSQHSNETGCLTLTDYGRSGSKHSGLATLVLGGTKYTFGTFQFFNHTLVATIEGSGYGQNAGLVFIGSANRGNIGAGVYDEVYGGEAFDEGALVFGMRNGC